jgi:acetylornithine/succinyldiaminopimelate/putrescine aminotransferase/predicted amino acid dehydrogenase
MKFAFFIHPLSQSTRDLYRLNNRAALLEHWGTNLLRFTAQLHRSLRETPTVLDPSRPQVYDHMPGLSSARGSSAEGRIYEIPMDAAEILADPHRAVDFMEQAVDDAAAWGAKLVGLGSLTGIVAGQGERLQHRGPLAVTTGNSLTVFAALQNILNACAETDIDLAEETVAVIGIPGSIATACARMLKPLCRRLALVGRRISRRAAGIADELSLPLLLDIPTALAKARIVVCATSTGNCVDQRWLSPGSLIIDVGVPADVQGSHAQRSDVLILSGGLARVPAAFPLDSLVLKFFCGLVPCCLGETIVLALENRATCWSIGRDLDVARINEIGALAQAHGFDFTPEVSFGLPLEPGALAQFLKARAKLRSDKACSALYSSVTPLHTGHQPPHQSLVPTVLRGNAESSHAGAWEPAGGRTPLLAPHSHTELENELEKEENGVHECSHQAPHDDIETGVPAIGAIANTGHNGAPAEHNGTTLLAPATPAALAGQAAARFGRFINPVLAGLGKQSGLLKTFVRGQGNELFDADGRAYLDFVAGFGALNLGHNHAAVVRAVQEALLHQAPGFAPAAINPLTAALAAKLVALAPPGLEIVFFCNSGAEAVEAALKLARAASGRTGLLFCERSFHGKSLGALSVTGNPSYQRPFGPLLHDCQAVPFGDEEGLERALETRRFAAFIVEPIQAEGGMNVPPPGYLRAAQVLCRKTATLLIADEIQTGLGRTGAMFAVEHDHLEPDLMTLAKSLGGGLMPIGAMLTRRDLWHKAYGSAQTFALHSSTFGGGSLACAAAFATLDVLSTEHLPAQAAERGRELYAGLGALAARFPVLREVRGQGLLQGVEFEPLSPQLLQHFHATGSSNGMSWFVPQLDETLNALGAFYAMQSLLQSHAIYAQTARSHPLVLRVQPPLTITRAQIQRFLQSFEKVCSEMTAFTDLMEAVVTKSIGEVEITVPPSKAPAIKGA